MAQDVGARITRQLQQFFSNGFPQVGLEVGADAGLAPGEYIQVPRSMRKSWAYRTLGTGGYEREADDELADLRGKQSWTIVNMDDDRTCVYVTGGKWYVSTSYGTDAPGTEVDDIYVVSHTYDDLRRFLVANTGHVREASLDANHLPWVHATRFWALATGLVVGKKNSEYTVVDDPTTGLDGVDELASQVYDYSSMSLTAASARAASWRKTNHATGGLSATGYPRRWLEQNKLWPEGNAVTDNNVRDGRERATSAFYIATHAVSVHNTLAIMAPTDEGHWACVDPRYGLLMKWEVMTSTQVRIAPKTQVAGTAMVVDGMVVFKLLLQAGIAPLLESYSEWKAMLAMYRDVESGGIRAGSYAQWFLDGHPFNIGKLNFNQKDSACANLVGELGAVARHYYGKSTIGQSMALRNAEAQLCTETAKDLWVTLARERQTSSADAIVTAYRRILGASATTFIANLASPDIEVVKSCVGTYNETLAVAAQAVGLASMPTISMDHLEMGTPGVDSD